MSHFTVLIIGENPEQQLAPFQENNMGNCPSEFLKYKVYDKDGNSHFFENEQEFKESGIETEDGEGGFYENPNAKWDWYLLGGRWTGFFKLKPKKFLGTSQVFFNSLGFSQGEIENLVKLFIVDEKKFEKIVSKYNGKSKEIKKAIEDEIIFRNQQNYPEHRVGSPGLMTEKPESGFADAAKKEDIDFDFMRKKAVEEAEVRYNLAKEIIGSFPINETWEQIRAKISDHSAVWEYYWNQPRCKAWRNDKRVFENFGLSTTPEEFDITKEEYLQKAKDSAISTFAIIKDGQWYEKGEMGWWGIVSDAKEKDKWNKELSVLLDSIPNDTLLSVYDCHI